MDRDWNGLPNVYRVHSQSHNGLEVLDAANALAQLPQVRYAEPDMIATCRMKRCVPNDPYFTDLWGLNNTGQSGGTPDVDMDSRRRHGM